MLWSTPVLRDPLLRVLVLILLLAPAAARAADPPEEEEGGMSIEEISRMLDNPLGNLWIIFMQNDMMRLRGDPSDSSQWTNVLTIQPIMPIPLTKNWNLVARPIIPFITAPEFELDADVFGDCPPNCDSDSPGPPSFSVDSSRENAWGDIMLWTMLSPVDPVELGDGSKLIWGAGPAARFPTATKDKFGSERYTFGPSAVVLRQPPEDGRWTLGLFQQHHIWSIGGNSDRQRVKTSQFQPIYWYQLDTETPISIGAAPMIDVNWEADSRDKWSIPLGIGVSATMFLGPMPVRVGVEFDWFVVSPDNYGKKFLIRFFFVPVIPRLIKEPIFGD